MSLGIAILATLCAMISRHAIHALLYFVLSVLALSIVIYEMGAPFAAALEVIIYAGAIVVLFVFVVMLLNTGHQLKRTSLIVPAILALGLIAELIGKTRHIEWPVMRPLPVDHLVKILFQEYGLLVELISFLLLAGLLAAYRIGKK